MPILEKLQEAEGKEHLNDCNWYSSIYDNVWSHILLMMMLQNERNLAKAVKTVICQLSNEQLKVLQEMFRDEESLIIVLIKTYKALLTVARK